MIEETSVSVLGLPLRRPLNETDLRVRSVLPVDPPRAHASGPAPYRVLAVGGRLLAGRGVTTHDLALTGTLARGVAGSTGHGVDVESIVLDRVTVPSMMQALADRDLLRIDALVLVLDTVAGGARPADLARRLHRLVDDAARRMLPASSITIALPAPTGGQESVEQAAFVEAVSSGAAALTRIVVLPDAQDAEGPAHRFATWGRAMASTVAESLIEPAVWSDPTEQLDEDRRSAAVQRLGPLDAEWEAEFQRLVDLAKRAYGARSASVAVIDGVHARYLARRGVDDERLPRRQTICDVALRTYGGVIVGDAQQDDRFRHLPIVRSGRLRFYAGYRLESPEGQPVGALCVFDPEPRTVHGQDIALLRDLAVMAERRIWERSVGRPST
jgi:GAF domain-containing protein